MYHQARPRSSTFCLRSGRVRKHSVRCDERSPQLFRSDPRPIDQITACEQTQDRSPDPAVRCDTTLRRIFSRPPDDDSRRCHMSTIRCFRSGPGVVRGCGSPAPSPVVGCRMRHPCGTRSSPHSDVRHNPSGRRCAIHRSRVGDRDDRTGYWKRPSERGEPSALSVYGNYTECSGRRSRLFKIGAASQRRQASIA